MTNLSDKFPSIWHLAGRAKKRIPFFAWEYLDSGTGMERLIDRNREALDAIQLLPRVLTGRFTPQTATSLFGQEYSVPFGIAPVGMSGLMWPGAELILAKAAQANNLPYGLSMVANEEPERVIIFSAKGKRGPPHCGWPYLIFAGIMMQSQCWPTGGGVRKIRHGQHNSRAGA